MQFSATFIPAILSLFAVGINAMPAAAPQAFEARDKCTPGTDTCYKTSTNWVTQTCNSNGDWTTSAECGSSQTCVEINSVGYCE